MTGTDPSRPPRRRRSQPTAVGRIALAFGGAEPDRATLDVFAQLAAVLKAELSGVFVEEQDLLRLAALPFARELTLSGSIRALEIADLERQLRRQAASVRTALARSAESAGARWSFAVARGSLVSEVRTVAQTCDLVVLGLTRQTGPLAQQSTVDTRRRQSASPRGQSIVTLFTHSTAAKRTLSVALRLARELSQTLIVLVAARTPALGAGLQSQAKALTDDASVRFVQLVDPSVAEVAIAARRAGAGLLVAEAGTKTLDPDALRLLNDQLPCPTLLVR